MQQTETSHELRHTIAEEYIEKLPRFLSVHQTGQLLQLTDRQVQGLIVRGEICARRDDGGIVIAPAENTDLFMPATLLRLPLPEPARGDEIVCVELALTRDARDELRRGAAQQDATPSQVIEAILRPDE